METGKSLAHYEILSMLGVGGMGEVWKACDTKLDRQVALKVLPREVTREPGRDTSGTRRPAAGFSNRFSSESHGVSPDGQRIIVSTVYTRQTLVIADELKLSNWK